MNALTGPDELLLAFAALADDLGRCGGGRGQSGHRSRRAAYVAARTAERLSCGSAVLSTAFRAALIQRLAASTVSPTMFGRERIASGAVHDAASVAAALTGAAGLTDIASTLASCGSHWDGGGRPSLSGDAIPLSAQLALAGDLADVALALTRSEDGAPDLPLAADLLASTAGSELSPDVAGAASSILADPALRRDLLDPAPAVAAIALLLRPLTVSGLDVVRRLVVCTEARHPYYQRHSTGTARIALAIGRKLGLDARILSRVELCALVHDVGELVLPDEVFASSSRFLKAPLSVREHPAASARFCDAVPFLEEVSQLVLLHHEHVDGLGYPRGLRGDAIPLEARIVGVADAVDAFHSERAHREALGNDEIARELAIRRGSVFDSSVVDAAIASIDFHT